MTKEEKMMWEINIENSASEVSSIYGKDVALSVFQKYDAHGFYDLSPSFYSEVFADLEQIVNDN